MPFPTSERSSDWYLYKYAVTPLATRLCDKVHPNWLTITNIALIWPIAYLLLSPRIPWPWFVVAIIVHFYLDCLDGEIARRCNEQSKLGGMLDITGDAIYYTVLGIIVMYNILTKRIARMSIYCVLTSIIAMGVSALMIVSHVRHVVREIAGKRSTRQVYFEGRFSDPERFFHDNGVVWSIVYALLLVVSVRAC